MGRAALPCCTALLMIVGASIGACGGGSEEVVARVGRTAITQSALDHWESIDVSSPDGAATASPRRGALRFLIWAAQTAGQAEDFGVRVGEARARLLLEEVEASWAANYKGGLIPREAELRRQLHAKGETSADRQWLMKVHLLAAGVEQAQIAQAEGKIPPAQVLGYYRSHRGRFVLPERRDITAIITWHRSTASKAKRELEAGESPKSVVERFNEQPSEGGIHIGLTRPHGPQKPYERDFFAARPHVLIGPFKELMYYVFEVTRIVPARQQRLGEVERVVRRKLISGQARGLLQAVVDASSRRWRASTHCAPGYVVPGCGGVRL